MTKYLVVVNIFNIIMNDFFRKLDINKTSQNIIYFTKHI